MTRSILRSSASSSLNPWSKIPSFSVRNGNLGAIPHSRSIATATTAEPPSPSPSPSSPYLVFKDTLFQRLMDATNPKNPSSNEPISQVLKQWIDEGRKVNIHDARISIRQFRRYNRYDHALDISEWICSNENSNFTIGDAIVRLDLIFKVHGVEQAEKYVESLPDDRKVASTYGALMNCYARAKLLNKAEDIMQKMRKLEYAGIQSYNCMLNLYSQMGERMKLESLVQEMENNGINLDKFSYNIVLSTYASASDKLELEKLLMKMEADPLVVLDWIPYSIAAKGYLKVGDVAKAEIMLKKSEELIKNGKQKGSKSRDRVAHALEVILTQYASMGRKDEVVRLWNMHNKSQKFVNRSYTCIVSCLLKLDDIDGAQKMLDEWLTKKQTFDIRIPNLLVSAYCKEGQMEKAELIISSLIEREMEPNASTWGHMASGYFKNNQIEDAVKMAKRAISRNPRWRPNFALVASCVEHLKGKGDGDGVEEIIAVLEEGGKFPADFRDRILRYNRKGNPSELDEMEQDCDTGQEEILEGTELKFENTS